MSKPKENYLISYQGYVIKGEATSPHNASKKAIRFLIKQGKIKQPPRLVYGQYIGLQCQKALT